MRLHARLHCRSWKNMERCFRSYLSHWANRSAASIKRLEVHELHASLGNSVGKTTANRVVQLLRAVYNRAVLWELVDCPNPARGITMYRLNARDRFFERQELARFFDAVQSLRYETTRDFLLICLLTACRRSNVAAMRWEHVSFEQATWTVPDTKNGTSQVVALVPAALAILARRSKDKDGSIWVFPSSRSPTGHLTKPESAWAAVAKRAGLANARTHDLRRTLASWQAITGANISAIAQTLHHKSLKSTMIYARLHLDPVRAAMNRAVNEMTSEIRR